VVHNEIDSTLVLFSKEVWFHFGR